jgi:NAD(P)-dependent dehydrogenase (short-subunit alcohol dehydrogenase family)
MATRKNSKGKAAGGIDRLFRLDGEVAVITGAASGIGRHAAGLLAEAGARVVLGDIDRDGAEVAAAALAAEGHAAEAMLLDVADSASVTAAFAAIGTRLGRTDILVNSAGIGARQPTEALSLERWNKVVAVNLTGTFLCAQAAGRLMLARGAGRIINIASIMGLRGNPLYPNLAYHATKGAIVNLTRALAVEWAPRGVRVNAIAPTFVRTKLTDNLLAEPGMEAAIVARTPLKRIADVEDISGAILFLASPAAAMVTGVTLPVDGGWVAQ